MALPRLAASLSLLPFCLAACWHESVGVEAPTGVGGASPGANFSQLLEGVSIDDDLGLNMTKLYRYTNENVTAMNQADRFRKLIISLQPCEGVVYLFVRRTRTCWPAPHSCCRPLPNASVYGEALTMPTAPPCMATHHVTDCAWTHFHSIIDGSQDGAPAFFEVPLSSSQYYISVFAPRNPNLKYGVLRPKYSLLALADTGAYPRPGLQGRLRTRQVSEKSLELEWDQATFVPAGVSGLRNYYVYSSLLLVQDRRLTDAVLVNPSKVMNSVCGLDRNAVRYGVPLTSSSCTNGICKVTLTGIVPKRRYMLNVVSESHRAYNASYSGIIVSTDWRKTTQLLSDDVMALIGGICGSVFGVVVMGYLWIVKIYN